MQGYGRYSHSQAPKQEKEQDPDAPQLTPADYFVLFIQDLFRFNRAKKILLLIVTIMVLYGHFWLGCK